MVWPWLLHGQIHTQYRDSLPRKMEFNEETGQTALIRHQAWPEKHTDHPFFTRDWPLFIPLSIFPWLFLTQPPQSLPFPAFCPSPYHLIVSFLPSHDAFPLHPFLSPIPGNPLSVHKAIQGPLPLTHGDGSHPQPMGPRLSWDNPRSSWGSFLWSHCWGSSACLEIILFSHNQTPPTLQKILQLSAGDAATSKRLRSHCWG